jgi:hypothetical protein
LSQAGHETGGHGIAARKEHQWHGRRSGLRRDCRRGVQGDEQFAVGSRHRRRPRGGDDVDTGLNHLGRQRRQALGAAHREAALEHEVLALDTAQPAQRPVEGVLRVGPLWYRRRAERQRADTRRPGTGGRLGRQRSQACACRGGYPHEDCAPLVGKAHAARYGLHG